MPKVVKSGRGSSEILDKLGGASQRLSAPLTLAEFMEKKDDSPIWLVPDFLPADSFVLVSGPPKRSRKTWFTLAMAMALLDGSDFAGREVASGVKPLVVEEEGARIRLQGRFNALAVGLGVSKSCFDKAYIHHRNRVMLDNPAIGKELVAQALSLGTKLVILDPLANMMLGNENKVPDVMACLQTVYDLRKEGITVVMITHTGKPIKDFKKDIDDEVRGSGSITGAYDLHLAFRPKDEHPRVPLTVRSRESADKHYTIGWQFDCDENDNAISVAPYVEDGKEPSAKIPTAEDMGVELPALGLV